MNIKEENIQDKEKPKKINKPISIYAKKLSKKKKEKPKKQKKQKKKKNLVKEKNKINKH